MLIIIHKWKLENKQRNLNSFMCFKYFFIHGNLTLMKKWKIENKKKVEQFFVFDKFFHAWKLDFNKESISFTMDDTLIHCCL